MIEKTAAVTGAGSHTDVTRHQGGLLEAASAIANATASATAARLSLSVGNDETSGRNIIYEKDGVPYIDSGMTFGLQKNNRENLDSDFIKLVESVTGS